MARRHRSTPDRWVDSQGRVIDEEDRGLVYDVQTLVSRRSALGLFGALGAGALLAGCGGTSDSSSAGGTTTASGSASASSPSGSSSGSSSGSGDLTVVPDETGGPYPGDGSNGVNVLDDSGIVRSDIRSTFGSGTTTTAEGVPLTIRLTVRDAATGDAKKGCAVYIWHCDRSGGYSLYGQGLEDVNYLRGVQPADHTGTVEFTSVFPGCTRPPVACDAHHLQHWADGGATALDNLVLLCRAHHTTLHTTPWQVRLRRDDRRPEFVPPPGRHRDPLPVRHRPLRTSAEP